MSLGTSVEQLEWLELLDVSIADPDSLVRAFRAVSLVRQRLDVIETTLAQQLAEVDATPEVTLTQVLDHTRRGAQRLARRARLLRGSSPACELLASAFHSGEVGVDHVDTFVDVLRALEPELHDAFLDDTSAVELAAGLSPRRFAARLRLVAERLRRQRGIDLLEQQKRQASMRIWTNSATGMVHLSGVFDPESAVFLAGRIDSMVQEITSAGYPDTCPEDPIDRLAHVRALALAKLIMGQTTTGAGSPDVLVVVDTTQRNEFGEPVIDWGLPVELPVDALVRVFEQNPGVTVVDIARNGRVVDRTTRLNAGRSSRLANRAQRRVLRAYHATCAAPDCSVPFQYCEIHHVDWWRHGGTTDLANLVPVCSRHHHRVHEDGWILEVDPRRVVRLRPPDGKVPAGRPPPDVQAA